MTTFVGLVPEETFARRIDNLYIHWWDWTSVDGIMAILHSLVAQGKVPSFSHFIAPHTVIIPQTLTSRRCSAPFRMTMPPRSTPTENDIRSRMQCAKTQMATSTAETRLTDGQAWCDRPFVRHRVILRDRKSSQPGLAVLVPVVNPRGRLRRQDHSWFSAAKIILRNLLIRRDGLVPCLAIVCLFFGPL